MVEEIIARIKGASDLYDILDIEKDVDESGLTKAYRKLAMKLHPDKCQLEGAEEAFKKVSGAYSQLKDPQQRAHYDRFGGSSDSSNSSSSFAKRSILRSGYWTGESFGLLKVSRM